MTPESNAKKAWLVAITAGVLAALLVASIVFMLLQQRIIINDTANIQRLEQISKNIDTLGMNTKLNTYQVKVDVLVCNQLHIQCPPEPVKSESKP